MIGTFYTKQISSSSSQVSLAEHIILFWIYKARMAAAGSSVKAQIKDCIETKNVIHTQPGKTESTQTTHD